MARYRRSHTRSFVGGLLLAGVPVGAFLFADHLLTPPSPGNGALSTASPPAAGVGRFARAIEGDTRTAARPTAARLTAADDAVGARPARRPGAAGHAPAGGKDGLVASIQQELGRVGCYAGTADGVWSESTRAAMQSFNTSVRVNLPTAQPDYILLTLLQGHSARACTRACDAVLAGGTCADPTLEAKAAVPAVVPSRVVKVVGPAVDGARKTWTTTTVVTPVTIPVRSPVAVGGPPASAVPAPTVAEVPAAAKPMDPTDNPAPLAGRMAVGAPPAIEQPKVDPRRIVTQVRAEAPRERPRPVNRPQRMFSDLSRSAP